LADVPLKVLAVDTLADDDGSTGDDDAAEAEDGDAGGTGGDERTGEGKADTEAVDDADEDLIPEFEELVDEES
jgi:hypothetical protein